MAFEHQNGVAPARDGDGSPERLDRAVETTAAKLRDPATPPADLPGLAATLLELQESRFAARERRLGERLMAVAGVQDALNRLRHVDTPAALLDQAPRELCKSCGFDRAVLSRVEGSEWILESGWFEGDPDWGAQFVNEARANTRVHLDHMLLETDMVRRRAPALVLDAQNDPRTFKPLMRPAKVRSYVSAPIMPQNRVIGFVHADHYFSDRTVDLADRDVLWTFAEGFGHVYERAILLERLRSQREQVRQMMESTSGIMGELCDAEIRLDRAGSESGVVARTAAAMFIPPEPRVDSLLTKREVEVLSLMAGGATNAAIAEQLVISEGTVKSHVKHILRKLRAANRAEAVSRYLRLFIEKGGDAPGRSL